MSKKNSTKLNFDFSKLLSLTRMVTVEAKAGPLCLKLEQNGLKVGVANDEEIVEFVKGFKEAISEEKMKKDKKIQNLLKDHNVSEEDIITYLQNLKNNKNN